MLSLTLPILYSTWIDPSNTGLAHSVGLSLLEGWQGFGVALLAGCALGRRKGDGTGFGLQGIDLSDGREGSLFCLVAEPDADLDTAVRSIGVRSPLPATELYTRVQFGFLNAVPAILGLIATQLNLSGRCRIILLST
jgi:hypothetical protein